jgi:hypothetical protein
VEQQADTSDGKNRGTPGAQADNHPGLHELHGALGGVLFVRRS